MNYSKNLRKVAMARRVILLVAVAAILGVVIGGISGYTVKAHIAARDEKIEEVNTEEPVETEFVVYGAYDDRYITEEIPIDWVAGDMDFTSIDCKMPEEQQEFVYYLCQGYDLDFTLVMALIQNESSFEPDVISSTKDYGYMQINKINHEWLTETLGITDYLDPYQNIRAGVFVLRKLFERYQDTTMVLMAYNMGETGAARLWDKGIYSTKYSESILEIQRQFNEQLEGH